VFRAFDQETERLVAVKVFALDLAPERVHQLVAELERLIEAALAHPAIAAPIAAGMHDNHAYLAMEYVSADSLDTAIRQYGAAPPADALRVAAQLAGALDFAAVVHVAHGALHPRDVLLSPEETRLTGLGIAAALERINVAPPVRRPYTPPEGIAGAEWDRRADVFSLAALMHELLWGKRVSAIGAQAGASLTQIPGGDLIALRSVFARALAERPADRFETALAFAQALTLAFPDAAHGQPVSTGDAPEAVGRSPVPEEARGARLPLDEPLPSASAPASAAKAPARALPKTAPAPEMPRAIADVPHPVDDVRPGVTNTPPPIDAPHESDFDLRQAEAARYQDVETAPATPEAPDVESAAEPYFAPSPAYSAVPASAFERSRSAIWPLALALLVGVAIGFAGGYGVGNHDRNNNAATSTIAAVQPPAAQTVPSAPAAPSSAGAVSDQQTPTSGDAPPKPNANAAGTSGVPSAGASAAARTADPPAAALPGKAAAFNLKSETGSLKQGRLLVRSTPAGAQVFVDGHEEGRTPVAVRELARGEHRVRVVHDGYDTEERRVLISASRPAQSLTLPLSQTAHVTQAPASRMPVPSTPGTTGRFVGALAVDSRPSGAKVFVDGKLAGTTPLQLAGLDAGEHVVRIERDGYRRWSSSVRVVASEQNRVTASLEK
jgi:eukaryotic-like serine/threonine-protein kinase